ncbi:MAG: low molecular weight protein arginine phosphatase [Gemmatimonadetes bacterium]|nr:low molecular weight protein arginine phosphatase [Gemmatimonadota bacterium]NNF39566.1 low molecular weight protein arginine phosphatase [Gemmatimonadota bacterium]
MSGDRGQPYRLLFVCTGNTCRSPLAEAIAAREIRRRGWSAVEVASAGTAAYPGGAASDGSLRAAARNGLDLSAHRSRPLSPELIAWADVVLTMSASHLEQARAAGASHADLLRNFAAGDDGGVPDPFGGSDEIYEATYHALHELVLAALDRLEAVVAP